MIDLKTKIPGPKSQALMAERMKQVARGPFHVTPIFIERASGGMLEDVDGNRFLDFASGIGVTNLGHSPEALVTAMQEQASRFLHAGFNVTPYEGYVRLAAELNAVTPGNFAKKTFLANSGAEAVENAVKIARAFTKRSAVVCFEHAFHGRTYLAMTLTHKEKPYKEGFGPFVPQILAAPFPTLFSDFEIFLEGKLTAKEIAGVIVEPVMGEGGFLPVPPAFLTDLRKYCDSHGIVLIADEIQTGFGRTGTLFACEQLGLVPDLLLSAKGLGGGMPISAVTGRAEIMDAPAQGGIGGTFGGNPVSCAAALEVLEAFRDGSILGNANALGEVLRSRLLRWKELYSVIRDVRGLGPMRAMEFPDAECAKALAKYALEHGVVLMTAGTYGNVVRFLFPLNLPQALLNEGLDVIERGLTSLFSEK